MLLHVEGAARARLDRDERLKEIRNSNHSEQELLSVSENLREALGVVLITWQYEISIVIILISVTFLKPFR